eukprot:1483686-Rhodomonas_salina.1
MGLGSRVWGLGLYHGGVDVVGDEDEHDGENLRAKSKHLASASVHRVLLARRIAFDLACGVESSGSA